ncbi:MAG: hypothetical protein COA69_12630 [Robiginitomaculum sp.]|nr:MAG: hypothetical protein COA69_12630 [Robiginitomaculum sp.]
MSDDNDTQSETEDLQRLLAELRTKHRQMDIEIAALRENGAIDMINIARMKKLKLRLKDRIRKIKDKLTPDIIA